MALGARRAFQERTANSERDNWLSLPFLGCDGLPNSGQLYVNRNILALRTSQQPAECILMDAHYYPEISKLKPR